jgi:hypothetical protein
MLSGNDAVLAAITVGHDTLMGVLLAIAGVLTIVYAKDGARNLQLMAIVGAVVTVVIGALLFFGIA